jgi:hypothetical protein
MMASLLVCSNCGDHHPSPTEEGSPCKVKHCVGTYWYPESKGVEEAVNHPNHYGGADNPYEAVKVIEAWGANFNLGNCLKYIARRGRKSPLLEDLEKAQWYLQREIDTVKRNAQISALAEHTSAVGGALTGA